ncbi:ATPase WRNIP1-like [Diadema antillarum]|uniref:ATPase WRNIP1-like n=1 Tax=Diadema antillarum TaxID=105358 RepID=UPI003A8BF1BE
MPRPVRQSACTPPKNSVPCPICATQCSVQSINAHLDKCLAKEESPPPKKKLRLDTELTVETESVSKPSGQLTSEWAAILTSPPSTKKEKFKTEKKTKKKLKKNSSGTCEGKSPKKLKTEKGEKSGKSEKTKKSEKSMKSPKLQKGEKKKHKKKRKDRSNEDVFDFAADEEKEVKEKVTVTESPFKPLTPSNVQMHNNKNVMSTQKKPSPFGSSPTSPNSPIKSPGSESLLGSSNQTSPSLWKKTSGQSLSPSFQTGKPSVQSPQMGKTFGQPSLTGKPSVPTQAQPRPDFRPLAERMRPYTLDTLIGQTKALGAKTALRRLLDSGNIPSMIFWGPPGCGKTSLANVIARQAKVRNSHRFISFSATTSNTADVKAAIDIARNEQRMFRRKTILFIDEIHRFNKTQQDTFLLHVENGTITLIGATTENPSFRVNAALLSRCRVVVLEKLSPESVMLILERALKECQVTIQDVDSRGGSLGGPGQGSSTYIERSALFLLANLCDGDARSALNSLQRVLDAVKGSGQQLALSKGETTHLITADMIKDSLQRSHIAYDRAGEEHYNCSSALQKSIRASDTNAALYWLGRMLIGGEDPMFVARRLVVCASEDIGMADSQALVVAMAAHQACHSIGMPECELNLAHCVTYLSKAPKSQQVTTAYSRVKDCIQNHQGPTPPIPLHLRTPATQFQLSNALGGWSKARPMGGSYQGFMPESLAGLDFFSMTS